jgi:hypothetical protein
MEVERNPFSVKLEGGNTTIVMAKDLDTARTWALKEFGRSMFKRVEPADEDDVDWVKNMGGRIHTA